MKVPFDKQFATVAGVATIALVGAVPTHANRPAEMSEQAYRALVVRSEALNDAYVARTHRMTVAAYRALRLRSEALERHYGGGAAADVMPSAAYRAVVIRSRALNQRYGLGRLGERGEGSRYAAGCGMTRRHW